MSIFQKSILKQQKQDESLVALRWAEFQNYLGYTLKTTNLQAFECHNEKLEERNFKNDWKALYKIQPMSQHYIS